MIEVVDNIKGQPRKNIPFEILKQGGITSDEQAIFVFEQDFLPGVGRFDTVSGPNSNVRIEGFLLSDRKTGQITARSDRNRIIEPVKLKKERR